MAEIKNMVWEETPIDVSAEANFIWSIANKLRGSYMPDKYGDVIIPMVVIRRFECTLEPTKQAVVEMYKSNPKYPVKAMCKLSGYDFYNTSEFTLKELCNDADHIAANFKSYIAGFSTNVIDILNELEMTKHIEKMDKDGCIYNVVKAFSELDLYPDTYNSIKMGYIFENLIGRFFQNVDAGQYYTGRDIIKLCVSLLMAEGCDDIFDENKIVTVPHVPDAQWFWEENLNAKKPIIKIGAEIPFTRYFYQYQQPEASEVLAERFSALENSVDDRIRKLFGKA